jgi:hypothetical protein
MNTLPRPKWDPAPPNLKPLYRFIHEVAHNVWRGHGDNVGSDSRGKCRGRSGTCGARNLLSLLHSIGSNDVGAELLQANLSWLREQEQEIEEPRRQQADALRLEGPRQIIAQTSRYLSHFLYKKQSVCISEHLSTTKDWSLLSNVFVEGALGN